MISCRSISLIIFLKLITFTSFGQKLYSAVGKASYYANKFEGRKTASGEIFSNKEFTAAHLTLPFGTWVKVTNLKNQKSVVVRINDRGPYIKGRIIDLSRVAADSLDFIKSGWSTVRVEEVIMTAVVDSIPPLPVDPDPAFAFPSDWVGNWKGELKIYDQSGFRNMIPMELKIQPTVSPDRYTWVIGYDTLYRHYELVIRDSSGRNFSIDEKNGIDINGYLLGNHFICRFEVENQLLECEYTLRSKDEMAFSIRAGDYQNHWSTGGIQMQSEMVPKVEVYPIAVMQSATLVRVK